MDFGAALKALKDGRRVTRSAWRPKGYWLVLVPGSKVAPRAGRPLGTAAPELIGATVTYAPHIDEWRGHGHIGPWTPSQEHLLAEDWMVV